MLIIKCTIKIISQIQTHLICLFRSLILTYKHYGQTIYHETVIFSTIAAILMSSFVRQWWLYMASDTEQRESDSALPLCLPHFSLWNGLVTLCMCVGVGFVLSVQENVHVRGGGTLTLGLQSRHHSNSHNDQDPIYLGQTLPLHHLLYLNLRVKSMPV